MYEYTKSNTKEQYSVPDILQAQNIVGQFSVGRIMSFLFCQQSFWKREMQDTIF